MNLKSDSSDTLTSLANKLYKAAHNDSTMTINAASAATSVLVGLGTDLFNEAGLSSVLGGVSFATAYFDYGLTATTSAQIASSTSFEEVASFANPISLASSVAGAIGTVIIQGYIKEQGQLLQQEVNLQTTLTLQVFPGVMFLVRNLVIGNDTIANGDAALALPYLLGISYVFESLWYSTDYNLLSDEWNQGADRINTDAAFASQYAGNADSVYSLLAAVARSPLTPVIERVSTIPKDFTLYQNFPNPFNPTTTVRFDLKGNSVVKLDIFNMLGQKVKELDMGRMIVGNYSRNIDLSQYASGVYFYRIEATSLSNPNKMFTQVKKMLLIR